MNKILKITLIIFGSITVIGGGYILYKKLELYKDKSVREDEEGFKSLGKILEYSKKKHSEIFNWYKSLDLKAQSMIEDLFLKLNDKDKIEMKKDFRNRELSSKTMKLLNNIGYNK